MANRSGSSTVLRVPWKARPDLYGSEYSGTLDIRNTWEVDSISHARPYSKGWDNGGPFFLKKTTISCSPAVIYETPYMWFSRYAQGSFVPTSMLYRAEGANWPQQSTDSALKGFGTTAIARSEPTNPAFSMSTAVGELMREGLPSIVGLQTLKSRSNLVKSAGSEYLNVEFGWKPLVSDIKSFAKAVVNSEEIITNYRQGSDKKIRRRYEDPVYQANRLHKTNEGGAGRIYFSPGLNFINGTGEGTMYESISQRRWFSGAFRYHVPVSDDQMNKISSWASNARKLLGVELTPEVVWNLSPWTWAIDWFTNTGDVLHNVSAMGRDGLVLQYGYAMMETVYDVSYQARYYRSDSGRWYSSSLQKSVKHCRRIPATPYGFDVDMNSLTAKRVAILAALGMSRVGK